MEKKRKEEEVVDSTFSLRSDANEIDDRGEDLKKLVSFWILMSFFFFCFILIDRVRVCKLTEFL